MSQRPLVVCSAAQRAQHLLDIVALDGDQHQRGDAPAIVAGGQADRIAGNHAVALEPGNPVLHGAAGDPQLPRDRGGGQSRIAAEQGDELSVEVIHGFSPELTIRQILAAYRSISNSKCN
jgi:ABC-type histidine transport system ATPase subunit